MQVNEFVGQVQRSPRRPKREQARDSTRETRAERQGADESRRSGTWQSDGTRMPCRYGAGF